MIRQIEQDLAVRRAEHQANALLGNLSAHTQAHIQERQRVAHAALGRLGDQGIGLLCHRLALGRQLHAADEFLHGEAPEIEALAAGEDGSRHFLRLRGREDKDHVSRRLLNGLEQRVERRSRQHMDFVDDIDLEPPELRRVIHFLQQIADLVDAAVGRRVHLHHVHAGAAQDALAGHALPAGIAVVRMLTVDRPGHDLGRAGFARAAAAAEQVGVGSPSEADLVAQGAHDSRLTDHIRKRLGPPNAVKGLIHDYTCPYLTPLRSRSVSIIFCSSSSESSPRVKANLLPVFVFRKIYLR